MCIRDRNHTEADLVDGFKFILFGKPFNLPANIVVVALADKFAVKVVEFPESPVMGDLLISLKGFSQIPLECKSDWLVAAGAADLHGECFQLVESSKYGDCLPLMNVGDLTWKYVAAG